MIPGELYIMNNELFIPVSWQHFEKHRGIPQPLRPSIDLTILRSDSNDIKYRYMRFQREDKEKNIFLYLGETIWQKQYGKKIPCLKLLYKNNILIVASSLKSCFDKK